MSDDNPLMQHAEKIIVSIVIATLIFVGTALWSTNSTLAVLVNRMDTFDRKLVAIDDRFERYQTKEQARAERETQAIRDQMTADQIKQLREVLKGRQ
ncbi:MAG: hypothetical protein R3180_00155 [Marinobacter sp.]|nr:hypothetical protein [Marinobacter sp.]